MENGPFHYVYILTSTSDMTRHYTGFTGNLSQRLKGHNEGKVPHTKKYRPWQIETAIAFRSSAKASEFERYLKTGSGRAFSKRHF